MPAVAQVHKYAKATFSFFDFLVLVTRQSAALNFAAQHVMPSEFGGKWVLRFPLPTLLYARYSVKLKKILISYTYLDEKKLRNLNEK